MPQDRKKNLTALKKALAEGKLSSAADLLGLDRTEPGAGPSESLDSFDARSAPAQAVGGESIRIGPWTCCRISPGPADMPARYDRVLAEYVAVMRGARQQFDELAASPGLCVASNAQPEELLFLSIEGTGGKEPGVFLVGLLAFVGRHLRIRQFLATCLDEDPAILEAAAARLEAPRLVVTFDTRRSDLALLRRRAAARAVDLPDHLPPHLNLRAELRKCLEPRGRGLSIRALEQSLFGFRRDERLDRRAIPRIYEHFLLTGDAEPLKRVGRCNLHDLLTMVQLLGVLLTGCEPAMD